MAAKARRTRARSAAIAEARQLMRYGEMRGALAQLDGIEQWCSAKTELGGNALLELGWCADACGDRPRAEAIMKKLMMNSPLNDIRRKAQQLGFQKEAADFLKLRDDDDADKPSEWSQLGKLKPVRTDKRYALTDGYLASPAKPVATLSEARMLPARPPRSARRRRLPAVLQGLRPARRSPRARLPPSSEAAAEQLQGEWLLGLSASESAPRAPPDAQQTSGGSLAPALSRSACRVGGLIRRSGEGGAKKGGALQLEDRAGQLQARAAAAGERRRRGAAVPDPCHSSPGGGSADVWARPAASARAEGRRRRRDRVRECEGTLPVYSLRRHARITSTDAGAHAQSYATWATRIAPLSNHSRSPARAVERRVEQREEEGRVRDDGDVLRPAGLVEGVGELRMRGATGAGGELVRLGDRRHVGQEERPRQRRRLPLGVQVLADLLAAASTATNGGRARGARRRRAAPSPAPA